MHDGERINPRHHIVEHNAPTLRKRLQLTHRRRFDDIEGPEKYKARKKRFPTDRDRDQRDPLPSDFIDDDKLWIFGMGCASHLSCRRNAYDRYQRG